MFISSLVYRNYWGSTTINNGCIKRSGNHLQYGSGCVNFHAPHQPYRITPLLLSHCRLNDQILCPPERGYLIHENSLSSLCPRDPPYTSHISKFSVFPRPFNNDKFTDKGSALHSLYNAFYCTTTYKKYHSLSIISTYSDCITNSVEKGTQTDVCASYIKVDSVAKKTCNPDILVCDYVIVTSSDKRTVSTQTPPDMEENSTETSLPCVRGNSKYQLIKFDTYHRNHISLPTITCENKCLDTHEDWLTFKSNSHLRYNTRYGSPVIQNTYSRGKKMIFYGVHTSVFRG